MFHLIILFVPFVFLMAQEVNLAQEENIPLIPQESNSKQITLQWLEDKPRTITKDFFIYEYLQQDITADQALEALGQAKNVNTKLFTAFAKKFNHDETYFVAQCMQASTQKLIDQHPNCIEVGLSIFEATTLTYEQRELLIKKLNTNNQNLVKILKIMNSPIPFTKLISSSNDIFFTLFNNCGSQYREQHFNYNLPSRTLQRLQEDPRFEATINRIVLNDKLNKLQESLFDLKTQNYSHETLFFLALNALKHKDHTLALEYLEQSYKKAYYSMDKDKVRFWQYKISKQSEYLDDLLTSKDINIYTLYAHEVNNSKPENIFYSLQIPFKTSLYDVNDPFEYVQLIKDTKTDLSVEKHLKYQDLFSSEETLPYLAYVTTKFEKYLNSYFITPYEENYFKELQTDQKALMYAIARQESGFIPVSISSAYALGVMQIMPFLGKEIANKLNKPFQTRDLLDLKTNLEFANFHLQDLKSRLKHPLFIAYAYNAGEGFVNKHLFSQKYFSHDSYEPFMSMELIPYSETRKYGKKVLANYYIYYNYLNQEKQTFSSMLEKLLLPFPE